MQRIHFIFNCLSYVNNKCCYIIIKARNVVKTYSILEKLKFKRNVIQNEITKQNIETVIMEL